MEDLNDEINEIVLDCINTAFNGGILNPLGHDFKDTAVDRIEFLVNKEVVKAREIFVPIRGYEGLYEISNTGKVRSIARGRNTGIELRQGVRFRNYRCVQLSKQNIRKSFNVHRLVAEAFISNPDNKRTVNHKDGNAANNDVSNLEWATYSEQEQHAYDVLGKVNANDPARLAELANTESNKEGVEVNE